MASKEVKKVEAPQPEVKKGEVPQPEVTPKMIVRVVSDELSVGGIITSKKKGAILNKHIVAKLKRTAAHKVQGDEAKSTSLYEHLIDLKAIEQFTPVDDDPAKK